MMTTGRLRTQSFEWDAWQTDGVPGLPAMWDIQDFDDVAPRTIHWRRGDSDPNFPDIDTIVVWNPMEEA